MHRARSQITIAAVALILGLLVVIQLRSQSLSSGLAQLSSQDLTVLVANLNARNDQLRREGSSLEVELSTLTSNRSRGDVSIDEPRVSAARVGASQPDDVAEEQREDGLVGHRRVRLSKARLAVCRHE